MSEVYCKRCGAADHMKNGIVRDVQRYLCRPCGLVERDDNPFSLG